MYNAESQFFPIMAYIIFESSCTGIVADGGAVAEIAHCLGECGRTACWCFCSQKNSSSFWHHF